MALTFLDLADLTCHADVFLLYAAMTFGGLAFAYVLVPEPKGVSLEAMRSLWFQRAGKKPLHPILQTHVGRRTGRRSQSLDEPTQAAPHSKLTGYTIQATDGHIGDVSDVLFDDATWKTRWLVVDTGHWLPGRKVLIHPFAIAGIDDERQGVSIKLTKSRLKESLDILHEQPVSRQMEDGLYGYYGYCGWDPYWCGNFYGMGAIAAPFSSRPYFGGLGMGEMAENILISETRGREARKLSIVGPSQAGS